MRSSASASCSTPGASSRRSGIASRPPFTARSAFSRRSTGFARNELPFEDPTGTDHDLLGEGLRKALYNYMHGVGLDLDVRSWFSGPRPPGGSRARPHSRSRQSRVPSTQVPADLIANALRNS